MKRRDFLSSIAVLGVSSTIPLSNAQEVRGGQLWEPGKVDTPTAPPRKGGLQFLTQHEFDTVGAIAERFIPADEHSVSAKEAGAAVFIDRELAGDYGQAVAEYRLGRFVKGFAGQGPQSPLTPAQHYRQSLAALDVSCQKRFAKAFLDLSGEQQDQVLKAMEANKFDLGPEVDTRFFFELILQNVRESFFADPLYGGNKDMASWKMLGYPGARYDFRDLLSKKGQKLNIIPTSLIDNTL